MRSVLFILASEDQSLPRELARRRPEQEKHRLAIFDLTAPGPDYEELLKRIFAADSIEVW